MLLRLDLNVPIEDGKVTDDFRLKESLPTINFLREAGAKTIIISHVEGKGGDTLLPVYKYFHDIFHLHFVPECVGARVESAVAGLRDGDVLLLENLRRHSGEKKNDPEFAKYLAMLGDIYVNEAFPSSHRAHASIVGVPSHLHGYAGLRFATEVLNLSRVFNPPRPFIFILGGAKFDTKIPLVKKFLKTADTVFIGGALANDCFKSNGLNVGDSVVSQSDSDENINRDLVEIVSNEKVMLPLDVVIEKGEKSGKGGQNRKSGKKGRPDNAVVSPDEVADGDKIWDSGPETLKELEQKINFSKSVLWNGPLGNYEIGYTDATEELARIIADRSTDGLESIIGGGDTVASIRDLGLEDKFTFLSTAGGAMLDFLVNETLPGIQAIENSHS